jgi:superfamily II DNA or RNA helicase
MRVTIANNILIERPTEDILTWCKRNLVLDNPEYEKKRRMGLWIGGTPEKLTLYEKRGDSLILPYGTLREILPFVQGADIRPEFKKAPEHIDYRCDIPLYDYQRKVVELLEMAQYGILASKAGSGKTQMGIALVGKFARKALWLTHTKDLLKQSMDRACSYMDTSLIGTITEGKVEIGTGITFATVQTMCRLDLAQYRDEWDVIIVDEAHRVCGSPTAMTRFYKVLNSLAARHKYGLSATVHRSDGLIRATFALLGGTVYTVPDEAVRARVMPVNVYPVYTGVQIGGECLNTDGTLSYSKLINYLCQNEARNQIIVSILEEDASSPSLILSDRLGHLRTLIDMLPEALRQQAVMIDGGTVKARREQALEDMRGGRKRFLFATFALAKEGLDIPVLERLYLTVPQKDYTVVTQAIGRVARTAEGKGTPVCFDFVDDIRYTLSAFKKRCAIYKKAQCTVHEGRANAYDPYI